MILKSIASQCWPPSLIRVSSCPPFAAWPQSFPLPKSPFSVSSPAYCRAPFTTGLNLSAIHSETDRRGFVPVNEKMQVLDTKGDVVPHVYCIGDANGKYMLAHAASAQVNGYLAGDKGAAVRKSCGHPLWRVSTVPRVTLISASDPLVTCCNLPSPPQGISAVENMCGRPNVLNHLSVPAACFTHPEVSFVGVTQEKAEEMAKEQGFPLGTVKTSFKANSKVRGEGMVLVKGDPE